MSDTSRAFHRPGYIEFKLNNKIHREGGPAIIHNDGTKFWVIDNKLHREDGPAVEYPDGANEWWYNGYRVKVNSQEEFEKYLLLKVFT